MNKRFMRSVLSAMLVTVLGGLATGALAVDVARVLVVQNNAYVKLYTIDDQNNWTAGDTIVTAGANMTSKRPMRAIYRDGIVYVLDMIADNSEYGFIRKYSLSGDYLGDVCRMDVRLDDFIFSADGRYIYVSCAFGACAGKIYRHDLETSTTELLVSPGGATRQMTWGPDGRLYVADRNGKIWGIDVVAKTYEQFNTSAVGGASGLFYDTVKELFYTSDTGGNVRSLTSGGAVTYLGNATPSRQCVWVTRINGAPHFFSLNAAGYNAIGVRLTDGGTFSTDVEWAGSFCSAMEIPLVLPIFEWKLDEPSNALVYAGVGTGIEIKPSRLLQSGVAGVQDKAVWFNASSYGRFEGSEKMIPATEDFTFAFWAGMPAAEEFVAPRTLFSNATGVQGDLTVAVGSAGQTNALTLSFMPPGGTLLSAVAVSDFADGNWHHVALRRQGTNLQAFVDGALAVQLTLPDGAAIAQTAAWHVGATALGTNPAGAGSCLDNVRFYGRALPANAIANLAGEFGAGALPTAAPALPVVADLPSALGTAVIHRRAIDAAISDSMLFKASDGSLYLVSGRGDGFRDVDRETAFCRSTDGGTTWTEDAAPTLAAGSVSLFERDGNLFALGLKNVGGGASLRTFAVWQLAAGAWEEKSSFAGTEGDAYALGTGAVAFYGTDRRFYKTAVCYFGGTNAYPAYVSFAYADGNFSDGIVTVTAVNGAAVYGELSSCTVADVLPGDTLIMTDNSCHGFYSFVDKRDAGAKFRVGPERTRNVRFNSRTSYTSLSAWMLPGGAKPYSIKYDAVSQLYWAVTVPVTNRQEAASVDAYTVAKRLGIYASPDLTEWWPCGVLLESDCATFRAPSFEIIGDDLLLSYGVATDDNAGGARGFDQPNYLAVRRVPNFRTSLVPEKPDGRYLIAANGGNVSRYWQTAGGQWMPGKTFASGYYGGVALSMEVGIAASGNVVYVGGEHSKGRIFVFDRKGAYLRTLEMPDVENGKIDSIRFAANGTDLIVTDAFAKQAVYRVNPVTGTWTELVSVASTAGTSGALDGRISKLDLATEEKVMIQNRIMDPNGALQLIWRDGYLFVSDARNYIGYRVNPDTTNEEDAFLYGFLSFARYAFIDENFTPGFFISIK